MQILKTADLNGDKKLSFEEFSNVQNKIFGFMDKNGDSFISKEDHSKK